MQPNLSRACIAEAIATFALVFIGAGAVLANAGTVGVALAHGLVLFAMITATAQVSGAHINPAVTIALLVTKRISQKLGACYILSQLAGATLAALLLKFIFAGQLGHHVGAPTLTVGMGFWGGVIIEAILTFFLVFTIFGAALDPRAPKTLPGLAIGAVLVFDILVGGGLTGAAMNPARAFGPALAAGFWDNQLVYWLGPIAGALTAVAISSTIWKR